MMGTFRDYTDEAIALKGEAIYEERIRPLVEGEHRGEYVVINIETGEWETGEDVIPLAHRLHARQPEAPLYALRIGYAYAERLGRPILLGHLQ
jgi:hypothetical protein